jgi:hypothetical protein
MTLKGANGRRKREERGPDHLTRAVPKVTTCAEGAPFANDEQ